MGQELHIIKSIKYMCIGFIWVFYLFLWKLKKMHEVHQFAIASIKNIN
jgi:hypothetical protein